MKFAGFFLLICGAALAYAAFAVLPAAGPRTAFTALALLLQLVGLFLTCRSHYVSYEGH